MIHNATTGSDSLDNYVAGLIDEARVTLGLYDGQPATQVRMRSEMKDIIEEAVQAIGATG